MTTSMRGGHCRPDDYLKVHGPDTGLARLFAFFESDGYSDPSAAWQAFTSTWNWAAPLTRVEPAADFGHRPVVRKATGGFTLSGVWHVPSCEGTAAWLALPLGGGERQHERDTVAHSGPDLFVVPSEALRSAVRGFDDGVAGPPFRLEDVHVPAGFVTHSAGTPLRPEDAAFLWTAVAALALGAARRMTDVLAGSAPNTAGPAATWPMPPAAAAAELAAVLHDERLSLAAVVHDAPSVRQGVPSSVQERLAPLVRQAGHAVHQVVASVYEHALASGGTGPRRTLVPLIEDSAPILHQARYVTELLPPDDRMPPRKAEQGDYRRISG
ncbi:MULTISPECIES: hypothetical protein [Streptomyces]|uniref:hypothetical protein n=1 Tax=Streptomyces TaxID=1883 RepID=UPI0023DD62A3|nr:hypothetical protein [Streptomyces sp. FXJ1.172]WEP00808.1 hypothetical protein A6P39_042320 [Streptomyces sp. FXJ1.172]